jgi:hypothetical protein
MRHLLLSLTLLLFISCNAQSDKNLIENWTSYQVPNNIDTLNNLGFSLIDWTVFLEDGKVNVINSKNFKSQNQLPFEIIVDKREQLSLRGGRSFIKVDDGYLVGFYRGEWGGICTGFQTMA